MQVLELVNPSDAITFRGDDPAIAGIAVTLLSTAYGLECENGDTFVPPFMFCSEDQMLAWFAERGVEDVERHLEQHIFRVAEFLDSCVYGTPNDRVLYEAAIDGMTDEETDRFRKLWNDRKRSSMNDIGRCCHSTARRLREQAATRTTAT